MTRNPLLRVQAVRTAYNAVSGEDYGGEVNLDFVSDLLSDLMLFARANGIDYTQARQRALSNFNEELEDLPKFKAEALASVDGETQNG